jgi:5-methylcytosine-specific restriction endonuclease McrBC regulatory subunit McrC
MFKLVPDLLIEKHSEAGFPGAVVDTKWKQLARQDEDPKGGVNQSDAYQVHAYATRYGMPRNVLLYPASRGATEATYRFPGTSQRMVVGLLRLDRDLRKCHRETVADMKRLLWGQSPPAANVR